MNDQPSGSWQDSGSCSSGPADKLGINVWAFKRRSTRKHKPQVHLKNYMRGPWNRLNMEFRVCCASRTLFDVFAWAEAHVCIEAYLEHHKTRRSSVQPLTEEQLAEARKTLICGFRARDLGTNLCWKRFHYERYRDLLQGLGVEILSDTEDIGEACQASNDVEPEWSAGSSEEESDVTVAVPSVAMPSVAMPAVPAGVSPPEAGPTMDGDPQVTSVAMTSPAVAVPVVPMDMPKIVVAPPPRRVSSEPVVRGAPAAPPPQPAVPTATVVERLPPATPVVPVGPAASSSHPQAEAAAQEFLQWMQTGTERQEAWVLLICEVIQILAAQKIGADAFDMRMFGSRVYEMALLDSDADVCLHFKGSPRLNGIDLMVSLVESMMTLANTSQA